MNLITPSKRFLGVWTDHKIRKARKDHRCDYMNGEFTGSGQCKNTIKKGDHYFDPLEINPSRAGGFGNFRYCKVCAERDE